MQLLQNLLGLGDLTCTVSQSFDFAVHSIN